MRSVWLLLGFVAATPPAPAADLALLFPAGTLIYAEARDPKAVGVMLAGLVKGTPWADPTARAHDWHDKGTQPHQVVGIRGMAAFVAAVTGPELAAELGRLGGAAVAITGVTPAGEPTVAAVVQFGDCQPAALAARMFVTADPDLRRVGTVEGVPIYQHHRAGYSDGPQPIPRPAPPPAAAENEPTYALSPRLFVVGSGRAAVADILARAAGKSADSLLTSPPFAAQSGPRGRPGVYLFTRPAAILAAVEAPRKGKLDPVLGGLAAVARFVVGVPDMPTLTATLAVTPAGIELVGEAALTPGKPNPVAGLLTGPPTRTTLPPKLPVPATWAVGLALPAGGDRVTAVGAFADALAKANGTLGPPPSARDWGWLADVPGLSAAGVPAQPLPLVVLHANGSAGGRLANALLQFAAEWTGTDRPAGTELVGGVKVTTFARPGTPPLRVAFGPAGGAMGSDPAGVAAAVKAPAGPPWDTSLLPDAPLRAQVDWKLAYEQLHWQQVDALMNARRPGRRVPVPSVTRGPVPPKSVDPYAVVLAAVKPAAAAAERSPAGLRFAVRQPFAPADVAALLDAFMTVTTAPAAQP